MFTLYFVNFGYSDLTGYATLKDAIAQAKKHCFQTSIYHKGKIVAYYCPLVGVDIMDNDARADYFGYRRAK